MLERIKRELRILGDDENDIVQDLIEDGKANINSIVGQELDYETNGLARKLLRNHCRYDYNNAIEFFASNFQSDIIRLQLLTSVGGIDEETSDAEGS